MLMTEGYKYLSKEEIKIGEEYYFGQLWDETGDGEELLESRCIAMYDQEICDWLIVNFDVVVNADDILETIVKVTSVD